MPEIDTKPMTDRVVVSRDGTAVRPDTAFHDYGVITRVIFVRGDGWSVGAPPELESVAHALWPDQWREFRRWPGYRPHPMSEYRGPERKRRP